MNRLNLLTLLTLLAAAQAAQEVAANGFRLAGQDALATARGEAFVATADNSSAVYYNPAGLTQLTNTSIRSGIYGIYLDPTFQPPAHRANSGNTYPINDQLAAVPQLFATHTLRKLPLSFGVGLYAPYGGSMGWPDNTGFRTVATKGALTYLRLSPAVAYQMLPSLSLGVGAMLDYAKIDLEQGLRPAAVPLVNYFHFSGDGYSVGYNVGLRWQPLEKISLGATFRSATRLGFDGRTEFEQQPFIRADERAAHMDLKFPWTAVLGLSYRPTPKWNFEVDADYTDWSSFGQTSIQQQTPVPYPMNRTGNVPVTLDWQASWMYEFGVTRYFDNHWHVSAGYVFNQSSVPDKYYTPLAADLDRHFFSLGAGFQGRRWRFDLAYQFGYGPAHTVTGSTPSSSPGLFAGQNADGTYDFISHAIMLTWGLQF